MESSYRRRNVRRSAEAGVQGLLKNEKTSLVGRPRSLKRQSAVAVRDFKAGKNQTLIGASLGVR